MSRNTLILGVGNEILSDDGIGPRLVKDLASMIDDRDLQFKTASCGGLEIMENLRSFDRAVFIDAIHTRDGFHHHRLCPAICLRLRLPDHTLVPNG